MRFQKHKKNHILSHKITQALRYLKPRQERVGAYGELYKIVSESAGTHIDELEIDVSLSREQPCLGHEKRWYAQVIPWHTVPWHTSTKISDFKRAVLPRFTATLCNYILACSRTSPVGVGYQNKIEPPCPCRVLLSGRHEAVFKSRKTR